MKKNANQENYITLKIPVRSESSTVHLHVVKVGWLVGLRFNPKTIINPEFAHNA
jgi:hypothetical protein